MVKGTFLDAGRHMQGVLGVVGGFHEGRLLGGLFDERQLELVGDADGGGVVDA